MYPRYPPSFMCIYNQDLSHDKCFTNPTHSMCGHYHCCRQLTCRENGTVDSIKGIIAEELITTGTNCPCCFCEKTLVKVPGQLSWLDVCCYNCKAIFEVKCSSTSEKNGVLEIRAGSWTGWLNKDEEAANMHVGKKSNKSYTWKGIIVILTTGCEYDISNVFFIPRAKIGKNVKIDRIVDETFERIKIRTRISIYKMQGLKRMTMSFDRLPRSLICDLVNSILDKNLNPNDRDAIIKAYFNPCSR